MRSRRSPLLPPPPPAPAPALALHSEAWDRIPARSPARLRSAIRPLKNEILQLKVQLSNPGFNIFVFPVYRIPLTASHAAGKKKKKKCLHPSSMYLFTVAMMWKEQARSIKSRNRAVKRMGARQAGNTATIPEIVKDLALPLLPWPPLQGRRREGLGDTPLHPIFAFLFARKIESQSVVQVLVDFAFWSPR